MKSVFGKVKKNSLGRYLAILLSMSLISGVIAGPVLAADLPADSTVESTGENAVDDPSVVKDEDSVENALDSTAGDYVESTIDSTAEENAGSTDGMADGSLTDAQTEYTITLDAGEYGFFTDEFGNAVRIIDTVWAEGVTAGNLQNPLPVPEASADKVFVGWSLPEDGSEPILEERDELIPEEGLVVDGNAVVYAVWADDTSLLDSGSGTEVEDNDSSLFSEEGNQEFEDDNDFISSEGNTDAELTPGGENEYDGGDQVSVGEDNLTEEGTGTEIPDGEASNVDGVVSGEEQAASGNGTENLEDGAAVFGDGEEAGSDEATIVGDGEEAGSDEATIVGDGEEAGSGEAPVVGDGAEAGTDEAIVSGEGEEAGSGEATMTGDGAEAGTDETIVFGEGEEAGSGEATMTGDGAEAGTDEAIVSCEGEEAGSGEATMTVDGAEAGTDEAIVSGEGEEAGSGEATMTVDGAEAGTDEAIVSGEGEEAGSGEATAFAEAADAGSVEANTSDGEENAAEDGTTVSADGTEGSGNEEVVSGDEIIESEGGEAVSSEAGAGVDELSKGIEDGWSGSEAGSGVDEKKEYTITFDANGGTFEDGTSVFSEAVSAKRWIRLYEYEEPAKKGFIFAGWSTVKNDRTNLVEVKLVPENDTTLYAVWTELKTVTFDANGGYFGYSRRRSTVWEEMFEKGEKIYLEDYEPDYDGWEDFRGWSLVKNGTPLSSDEYIVNDTVTLYAVWIGDIEDAEIKMVSSRVYTGKAQKPAVTLTYDDRTLKKGTDYTVTYSNNINVGKAYVKITGKGRFEGSFRKSFRITKATQKITLKAGATKLAVGKTTTFKASGAKGTTKYTWKSSNTSVASVTSAGKVTAKKVGTVSIKVSTASTANYKAATCYVTIKVVPAATRKLKAANQKSGVKLTWTRVTGANGYLIYRNGTKIATISKGTTLTYMDKKANKNGKKYTYKLIAKASTGISTLVRTVTLYRTKTSSGVTSSTDTGTSTGTGSSTSTGSSSTVLTTRTRYCFEKRYVSSTLNKCVKNDLAVIDLDGISTSVIKSALARGVQIYGYLNAGALEDDRSYYSKFQSIRLAQYDGWDGEYWVDVTAAVWKTHLIEEAKKIKAAGATGIYFDNTDILYMVEAGFREEKTKLIRTAPSAGNVYKALADVILTIEKEVGLVVMPNGGDIFVRRFVEANPKVLKTVVQECVVYEDNKKQSASDRKYLTEYLDWCKKQGIYIRGIEYINTTAGAAAAINYYESHGWQEVYISKQKNLIGN